MAIAHGGVTASSLVQHFAACAPLMALFRQALATHRAIVGGRLQPERVGQLTDR